MKEVGGEAATGYRIGGAGRHDLGWTKVVRKTQQELRDILVMSEIHETTHKRTYFRPRAQEVVRHWLGMHRAFHCRRH